MVESTYFDIDETLRLRFEDIVNTLGTSIKGNLESFITEVANIIRDDQYDSADRSYIGLVSARVLERIMWRMYQTYMVTMPPSLQEVFHQMYPDHIILTEASDA